MTKGKIIEGPKLIRTIEASSIGELFFFVLKAYGDTILLADAVTNEEISATLILNKSICLAKWLQARGIGPGHFVAISSENRFEFFIATFATFFVGATLTAYNPEYTPAELKHLLSLTHPVAIFCSELSRTTFLKMLSGLPYVKHLILVGKGRFNYRKLFKYDDIVKGVTTSTNYDDFVPVSLNPEKSLVTVLYSSGTTGLPKGVMCTHRNMISFFDMLRQNITNIGEMQELTGDTSVCVVPTYHAMGFMIVLTFILNGRKTVLMSAFHPKLFLDTVVKYKIQSLQMPPTLWNFLLKHPMVKNYDLSHLKLIAGGSAPISESLQKAVSNKFPSVLTTFQSYGLTESILGLTHYTPLKNNKLGSVGKLLPDVKCKVINEQGEILGPNEAGELCFSGPNVAAGYIGNPEATAETFCSDGFLHTGDVGYYDDDEYLFVVDRKKELIKYKGYQVAPAEIESLLMKHSGVADAAVVGLPDEKCGELPLAFVVKAAQAKITAAELEKYVSDNVSPQKRLRGGVHFTDSIPKTPVGKILRRVLKERATKMKSKL